MIKDQSDLHKYDELVLTIEKCKNNRWVLNSKIRKKVENITAIKNTSQASKNIDIIIGVDVQDDLLEIEELESLSNILNQISNFRAAEEMSEKSVLADIYIKPDVADYSIVSFPLH